MPKYRYMAKCQYCPWTDGTFAAMSRASDAAGNHVKSAHPEKRPRGVPVGRILQHAHYEAGKVVGK